MALQTDSAPLDIREILQRLPHRFPFQLVDRQAGRSLNGDGVLVVNLSGQKIRYAVHIQGLCDAFDGTVVLVPVQDDDNVLLFAFRRPPLEAPQMLHDRATELEEALGLDFHRFLQCLRMGPTLRQSRDCSR